MHCLEEDAGSVGATCSCGSVLCVCAPLTAHCCVGASIGPVCVPVHMYIVCVPPICSLCNKQAVSAVTKQNVCLVYCGPDPPAMRFAKYDLACMKHPASVQGGGSCCACASCLLYSTPAQQCCTKL